MKDLKRLKPIAITFFVAFSLYLLYSFIPYALAQDTEWDDDDWDDEEDPEGVGCCGALFCFAFIAPLLLPFVFILFGIIFLVAMIYFIVWAVKKGSK